MTDADDNPIGKHGYSFLKAKFPDYIIYCDLKYREQQWLFINHKSLLINTNLFPSAFAQRLRSLRIHSISCYHPTVECQFTFMLQKADNWTQTVSPLRSGSTMLSAVQRNLGCFLMRASIIYLQRRRRRLR